MIHVGPAGWSYPDWEGRVYPRPKPAGFEALRFLADFVDCVEVNSTFYAQPRSQSCARWASQVAHLADFRFVAKLYREFTHTPDAWDEGAWSSAADEFRAGIRPLERAHKLSALLVQFPVSFRFGPVAVRRLGRIASLFEGLPRVLEVRHRTWFAPEALASIRGLSYSLAHIDLPEAWEHPPHWHAPTGPIGYVRLHGRNARAWFSKEAGRDEKYDYLYSPNELRPLADRARALSGETEDTYVITNNHFSGKAVSNALELQYLLRGEEPLPAPRELVDSFPHLGPITRPVGQGRLFN